MVELAVSSQIAAAFSVFACVCCCFQNQRVIMLSY